MLDPRFSPLSMTIYHLAVAVNYIRASRINTSSFHPCVLAEGPMMIRRSFGTSITSARGFLFGPKSSFQTPSPSFQNVRGGHHSQHRELFRRRRSRFSTSSEEVVKDPPLHDLRLVALAQAIPFVGFGFMDNSILILAGDAIDTNLGVMFGFSTMCAAAIGNIISDLAGIGLGSMIEDFCAQKLNLPVPNISTAQRKLRSVRFAGTVGMAVGMTVGCIIGMFPLLFIDSNKIQNLKKKAHLESLFLDVVTEAKSLIGAESTCLYLRVTQDRTSESKHDYLPFCPAADGEYLYAMYYVLPSGNKGLAHHSGEETKHQPLKIEEVDSSRFIPLGKGIVSRAILTGQTWEISDVTKEPDFSPEFRSEDGEKKDYKNLRDMVVVPVLDYQGRPIAVIRAMNKIKEENSQGGFTHMDVQILKALASHISVSLNSVYQDQDDEEVRLRDTIRILKEQGIQAIQRDVPKEENGSLFPKD